MHDIFRLKIVLGIFFFLLKRKMHSDFSNDIFRLFFKDFMQLTGIFIKEIGDYINFAAFASVNIK